MQPMHMYNMAMQINGHVENRHVGKWACQKMGMQEKDMQKKDMYKMDVQKNGHVERWACRKWACRKMGMQKNGHV